MSSSEPQSPAPRLGRPGEVAPATEDAGAPTASTPLVSPAGGGASGVQGSGLAGEQPAAAQPVAQGASGSGTGEHQDSSTDAAPAEAVSSAGQPGYGLPPQDHHVGYGANPHGASGQSAHSGGNPVEGHSRYAGAAHTGSGQQPGAGQQPVAHPSPGSSTSRQLLHQVRGEIGKTVQGNSHVISGVLVALLADGHILLEGVPGTAKTLLVRTLAQTLSGTTSRVQFTPDLMPGDITGSTVYDAKKSEFRFVPGPVFANILLADEINRTPPKTQAALLQAMEERAVTVDGTKHALPEVFCVAATQNPIEQEGTYPLPEAQLDRFMVKLLVGLPDRDTEYAMVYSHAHGFNPNDLLAAGVRKAMSMEQLVQARSEVAAVVAEPGVLAYLVDICRATRTVPSVLMGVSPRGATALLKTARAWAWLSGRDYVTPDDVKILAPATIGHRIRLRPEAELDDMTTAQVVSTVLSTVDVPR